MIMTPAYTNNWFGVTAQNNFEFIAPAYVDKPTKVLEIGCFEGRASNWIVENICKHPDSLLTCVDPFTGSEEHTLEEKDDLYSRFLTNISSNSGKIRVVKKQSLFALTAMIEAEEKFDLIYVDGDHKNSSVVIDGILADRLLVPGGVIIFDDYAWKTSLEDSLPPSDRPKEAIEYFFSVNGNRFDIVRVNWQVVAIKKSD